MSTNIDNVVERGEICNWKILKLTAEENGKHSMTNQEVQKRKLIEFTIF